MTSWNFKPFPSLISVCTEGRRCLYLTVKHKLKDSKATVAVSLMFCCILIFLDHCYLGEHPHDVVFLLLLFQGFTLFCHNPSLAWYDLFGKTAVKHHMGRKVHIFSDPSHISFVFLCSVFVVASPTHTQQRARGHFLVCNRYIAIALYC